MTGLDEQGQGKAALRFEARQAVTKHPNSHNEIKLTGNTWQ